jgi:plasmid stability protein
MLRKKKLAKHAFCGYTACMKCKQYTLRAIPDAIDSTLRRRAKKEGKSLNAIAIEALARGLELDAKPVQHTDLDALIGSWQEDALFDQAVADFERVDEEAWK